MVSLPDQRLVSQDFPGDPVVQGPPANEGDMGSISGQGKSYILQSN